VSWLSRSDETGVRSSRGGVDARISFGEEVRKEELTTESSLLVTRNRKKDEADSALGSEKRDVRATGELTR